MKKTNLLMILAASALLIGCGNQEQVSPLMKVNYGAARGRLFKMYDTCYEVEDNKAHFEHDKMHSEYCVSYSSVKKGLICEEYFCSISTMVDYSKHQIKYITRTVEKDYGYALKDEEITSYVFYDEKEGFVETSNIGNLETYRVIKSAEVIKATAESEEVSVDDVLTALTENYVLTSIDDVYLQSMLSLFEECPTLDSFRNHMDRYDDGKEAKTSEFYLNEKATTLKIEFEHENAGNTTADNYFGDYNLLFEVETTGLTDMKVNVTSSLNGVYYKTNDEILENSGEYENITYYSDTNVDIKLPDLSKMIMAPIM